MAQARTRARRRRTLGMLGLAAVAIIGLAGCAAGQDAQTAQETPAIDGTATKIGVMYVQAAAVVAPDKSWPQGGNAPLQLVLINTGLQTDQLTHVSTDAASSVVFFRNGPIVANGGSGTAGTGTESTSETASPGTASGTIGTASPSGPSGPSVSGSASGFASGASLSVIPQTIEPTIDSISIAPSAPVSIGRAVTDQAIVLKGLTKPLFPAQSLQITLTFQHAGTGSLAIPVHLGAPPSNRPTLNVSATEGSG